MPIASAHFSRPASPSARSCRSTPCSNGSWRPPPGSRAHATRPSASSIRAAPASSASSTPVSTRKRRTQSATCREAAASPGVLIEDARPLRLHDLNDDPRAVGFPPNHPEMRTFLGVPILLRDVAYGNLYLTEKHGGEDFSEGDEELVTTLATQAAVAIENARLYESATAWSRQLESLNEIGNALVSELDLPRLLDLIARRLRELIAARVVAILLPAGGELRIAAADGENVGELVGVEVPRASSKAGRIFERGRSERVDSTADDPEVDQEAVQLMAATSGRLRATARARRGDRRDRRARQARLGCSVHRRRPPARRAVRRARRHRRRPFTPRRPRLAPPRRRGSGAGAPPTGARTPRRDRPGADIDPARAQGGRERPDRSSERRRRGVGTDRPTLQDVGASPSSSPYGAGRFGPCPAVERSATISRRTESVGRRERTRPASRPEEIETTVYRIVPEALTNVVKHARRGTSPSSSSDGRERHRSDRGQRPGFDTGASRQRSDCRDSGTRRAPRRRDHRVVTWRGTTSWPR